MEFYNSEIVTLLQTLESSRVAELKKFGLVALIVLSVNLIFFLKFHSNFILSLGLGFIVLVGAYYLGNTRYKTKVENTLIPKLIQKVDSNFSYLANKSIDIQQLNNLQFFSHKIENSHSSGEIQLHTKNESAHLSFVTLESIKVDTEEGRHATKRFDGALIELKLAQSFDQRYLFGSKTQKTPQFEAGDYLNPPHMGLKSVISVAPDWVLYSQDGESALRRDILEKVIVFKEDLKKEMWVIFEKKTLFILVENIHVGFEISLFHSLKNQDFIRRYIELLQALKKLLPI